jgi:hypothetical protein
MMSKYFKFFGLILTFIVLISAGSSTLAQTTNLATTFSYQGFLSNGGNAFTGDCDFQFNLFNVTVGGAALGPQNNKTTTVSGGVFTVQLDFGAGAGVFDGTDRFLAIAVRCPPDAGFTPLTPRQPITSSPYALYATSAANAANAANATNAAAATIANGLNGLIVQQNATSPNLLGGFNGNFVMAGVVGATIGGGGSGAGIHQITDIYGTIGGGQGNTVGNTDGIAGNAGFATVSGGVNNSATGPGAFVGGGEENTASGYASVVPGGNQNAANADFTFAGGKNATANETGAFVWSDSTGATLESTANNQFMVRASGGFVFYSNAAADTGIQLPAGSGSWTSLSDKNAKNNFAGIDSLAILDQVAEMPISTWNYIAQGESVRHIGPMAQDFYAAFGLGEDERHISTVDADGIALAAIQGLYQIVQDKDTQIDNLQAENAELKTRLDDLDQRLAALESLAAPSQAGLPIPALLVTVIVGAGVGFMGRRALKKGQSL